jgi:cytochrome c-type biogenesis protein CcmE
MSRIDDELEQAVREGDHAAGAASGASSPRVAAADVTGPVVADAEERKRGLGLLAGLLALMGGVLVLVFNSGQDAVVYSYKVDELQAKSAELVDRQVRVQGSLVSGTLTRRDKPCEYRFQMRKTGDKNGAPLGVQFPQCVVPDQFRDVKGVEVEVTAEGRLLADGTMEASKIFAKCPSKYEMRDNAAQTGKVPEHGGGAAKPEFIAPRVEAAIR